MREVRRSIGKHVNTLAYGGTDVLVCVWQALQAVYWESALEQLKCRLR